MKRQWFRTVTVAGVLTAVAVSAQAGDGDFAKNAADRNPFYLGVGRSATVSYEGLPAPAEDDHAKNAADRNPFYLGVGRSAAVAYEGLPAPADDDHAKNAADRNPFYRGVSRSTTVTYPAGESR